MIVIDLSVPIYTGMNAYSGDPKVSVEIVHTYAEHNWQLRKITLGSHAGTHVDAFSHMNKFGKTLDQIPLKQFFGKAYIADRNKPFPNKAGLFFREEAGLDLFEKIIEAQPPFVGGEINEPLESSLLHAGVLTYTNLINLELLPIDRSFLFYGFPLKIKDGDGSPVRAVAIIE